MYNKSLIISLAIICTILIGVIAIKIIKKKNGTPLVTIGILQTASHPALDAARNGFVDEVKKTLGNKVEFIIHNAEGSITTAHTIAQHFHADSSIAAVYAIATPALQAIASIEQERPVVFAAVTDPYSLGIIQEKTNISGITDMIDIPESINIMKQLLPHVSVVALVYNPSESNSVIQIKKMEQALHQHNISSLRVGISTETEVPQAIASALTKTDALLLPTDNLIASAMPIISHLAREAKKPIIASHNAAVEQGALMACGVDYYMSGGQVAKIGLAIVTNGKKPYDLPIRPTKSDKVIVNKMIVKELELSIPETLKNKIVFVDTIN